MRRIAIAAPLMLASCATLLSAVWVRPNTAAAAAPAGGYALEAAHTQVMFSVVHMGLTNYYGVFTQSSGSLEFDPADAARMSVQVSVNVASLRTTSAALDTRLKSAGWLDAARYPQMLFRSTRVVQTGPDTANIEGLLTLHGQTHPLVLSARFNGAGPSPLTGQEQLGFQLAGVLRRSEWGVANQVPIISDAVTLIIPASFVKR